MNVQPSISGIEETAGWWKIAQVLSRAGALIQHSGQHDRNPYAEKNECGQMSVRDRPSRVCCGLGAGQSADECQQAYRGDCQSIYG